MKHLISIDDLALDEIVRLLDLAEWRVAIPRPREALAGRGVALVFGEASTRTRVSFERAAHVLGASVQPVDLTTSATRKGESIVDTAMVLEALGIDVIVIRSSGPGDAASVAGAVGCAVVNAGCGDADHPTQALVDVLALRRRKGRIDGLRVAVFGDALHSRVMRSTSRALAMLGATVRLVAPERLTPADWPGEVSHHPAEGLAGADAVLVLRPQKERWAGDYAMGPGWRLDAAALAHAKPDAVVMHPGPVTTDELDPALARDPQRSLIMDQVRLGVPVRIAVLETVSRALDETGDGRSQAARGGLSLA